MSEWPAAAGTIGNMLSGMGAGMTGKGELWQRNQLVAEDQRQQRQRQNMMDRRYSDQQDQLAAQKEAEFNKERSKTLFYDVSAMRQLANQGKWNEVAKISASRMEAAKSIPGVDFTESQIMMDLAGLAANGNQEARTRLGSMLDTAHTVGVEHGILDQDSGGGTKNQFDDQGLFKDSTGQMFNITMRRDPSGDKPIVPVLTAINGDPDLQPDGPLMKVEQYGLTASQDTDKKGRDEAEKEAAKLSVQLKLSPTVQAAVTDAVGRVNQSFAITEEKRTNAQVFTMYESAMDGLAASLADTATGPVAGWIPAMTANAQIAEGSLALMAPVLKGIFRQAGEGTFTKDDQEILMDMLPDRKDKPAARIAKMTMVDSIVRAKLGAPPRATSYSGTEVVTPQGGSSQGWSKEDEARLQQLEAEEASR